MSERIQIVKGFQDVLPPRSLAWAGLERQARDLFRVYGFQEVRLPIVEPTELFVRSIGEDTDIVEKEMFTFPDRKGRSLSLRPEGTASAVRAYLEAGLGRDSAVKWFYLGPMFRYERPQKGRHRQFWQLGAEAIGHPGPGADAELIIMLERLFNSLGVMKKISLELNSLGCPACRPAHREALLGFLGSVKGRLCGDCARRLDRNPLRVLDCKLEGCQRALAEAPSPLDHLCGECREHFSSVREDLELMGVKHRVNPRIVRGLDYYTRTVFEFLAGEGLGAQNAVAAGGRYDGLVQELGGPATPATGFALGIERTELLMESGAGDRPDYFIAAAGGKARAEAKQLLFELRDRGLWAEMMLDEGGRSLKAQMKTAGKVSARAAIIIGDDELARGELTIKELESGEQRAVKKQAFIDELEK